MFLKRIPQSKYATLYIETPKQKRLRFLLVLIIFSGIFYGFWQNSASQIENINLSKGPNSDATHTLSKKDISELKDFAQAFKVSYGLALDVRVQSDPFPPVLPKGVNKNSTVFIGLCPDHQQVFIALPPLAGKALPPDFAQHLESQYMEPAFVANNWPEGLAALLNALTKEFDKVMGNPINKQAQETS